MAAALIPPFDSESDILLGAPDARAAVVWFVDFACPHTRWMRDVLLRVAGRFDKNDVAVAFRFLPGEANAAAELAARAAIAAAKQGRYIEMHRALFARGPDYDDDAIREAAEEAGLDPERHSRDMASEETTLKLKDDRRSAEDSGALDTPIIFIDGRRYRGAWDETSVAEAIEKPLGYRLRLARNDFFRWAASAGLVLIAATAAALLFVNSGGAEIYRQFNETVLGITIGDGGFSLPVHAWVNDGLMAVFFLIVGIEIKREIVDGELSDLSSAALPVIGAIGGMVVPALIFVAVNLGADTIGGWGVPMATDIAFTLGLLAILGTKVPTSLKVFVSALAIADDLGAIVVIALFYGHGFDLHAFGIAAAIFGVMVMLNRARVYGETPYLLLGVALWFFIHESGLHATVAGVLTALAIPSRPSARIEGVAAQTHAIFEVERQSESAATSTETMEELREAYSRLRDPGFHLQHRLENWSSYLILPLFAFVNTGLVLGGSTFSPFAPEALGVILGLVAGKPLGIVFAVFIAVRLGWARLPGEIGWMQLIGAGCLCGIGFTMSIFIASAAFQGDALANVKIAILLASVIAAAIGLVILWSASRRVAISAAASSSPSNPTT